MTILGQTSFTGGSPGAACTTATETLFTSSGGSGLYRVAYGTTQGVEPSSTTSGNYFISSLPGTSPWLVAWKDTFTSSTAATGIYRMVQIRNGTTLVADASLRNNAGTREVALRNSSTSVVAGQTTGDPMTAGATWCFELAYSGTTMTLKIWKNQAGTGTPDYSGAPWTQTITSATFNMFIGPDASTGVVSTISDLKITDGAVVFGTSASGTGALSLSASGSAAGTGVGTAALSLTGAGVTGAQATATGALSLSGSATAGAATGAGEHYGDGLYGDGTYGGAGTSGGVLTLTATHAASTTGSGTAALSLTGSSTVTAAGTASASLSLTGSGTTAATSTASASLSLSGSSTAAATTTGAASLSLAANGSATARATSTAALTLTGSGSGTAPTVGAASLSLTATGATTSPASSAAALTLSASGAATIAPSSGASLTLNGTGAVTARTSSAASLSLSGNATNATTAARVTGSAALTLAGIGGLSAVAASQALLTLAASGEAFAVTLGTTTPPDRILVIAAENRTLTASDDRVLHVGVENRTTAIAPLDRTIHIPAVPRVLEVTP